MSDTRVYDNMNSQPKVLGYTSGGLRIRADHEYSESCNCRDCHDEHVDGEADAAAALRTTDWDWGRE